MPEPVFYSVSPFGTGTIETGAGTITITDGVATLSVAQTGNIGAGVCIEYNSLECFIAPNRIGFDSGGTAELLVDTKIEGETSDATGIVRFVELTSGTWAGGDAAGWIYFEKTTGTFQDNEQINRTKPTSSTNIATTNGSLQGNIGGSNDEYCVKTATGGTPANQTATAVTSIHHVWATLSAFEAAFTGASFINNTDLTDADVVAHACIYYDHADYTPDSTSTVINWGGTTDATRKLVIYTPTGNAESISNQRHSGKWDSNKAYTQLAASDRFIEYQESFIDTQGLQLDAVNATSAILDIDPSAANGEYNIDSTIGKNATGTYQTYINAADSKVYTINVKNSVLDGNSGSYGKGIYGNQASPILNIFHCTVYNMTGNSCGYGIGGYNAPAITATNNAVFLNTDDFFGTNNTITYCASDDEDGTNSQLLDSSGTPAYGTEFTDAAGGDFSLPEGSICIDNGTSLASSEGIWRDIAGNERGATPDIGAFEYIAAAGTTITVTDIATGADSLKNINVGLSISDTGAGSDNLTGSAAFSISDTGSGADNLTGSAAFSVTDAGTGTDSLSAMSVSLTVQDTSAAVDLISGILNAVNISDTGSGIDAIAQVISSLLLSDTGAGIDSVSINTGATIKTVTDTATGVDSLTGLSVNLNINDAAAASDIIGQIIAGISVSDTAQAADIIETLKTALITVSDTASGDDSVSVTASVTVSDAAQAADIINQVAAFISTADSGFGTDVVISFSGTATGKFKITFTAKAPSINFTAKKPDITFN